MKILIIKLGALGDIIIATAIIKRIQEHHANDDVHILTIPRFIKRLSQFDKVTVTAFERKGLLNFIKTIRWIRTQGFDRLYDLQSNDRTAILCALSGIAYRAGNHPRYPYHIHPKDAYIGQCHAFERLNQIIECAGIMPAKPKPFLPAPPDAIATADAWIRQHGLVDNAYVLLHAGGSATRLVKRWPYFAELSTVLNQSYGLNIVWIGSDDEITLNQMLSQSVGINATNAFNDFVLVELGKRARFAITNDSAPMHILACSDKPVFGLFGPTFARRSHALGQQPYIISPNKMLAKNDHDFKPMAMSLITVQVVLDRLKTQKLL